MQNIKRIYVTAYCLEPEVSKLVYISLAVGADISSGVE